MSQDPTLVAFMAGLQVALYLVAGGFFLRFWRRSRDSLFLIFAIAFVLMAMTQAAPVAFGTPSEISSYAYVLRLIAFVLIIVGIVRKNTGRARKP